MANPSISSRLAKPSDLESIASLEDAIFPARMRFSRRQIRYLLSSARCVTVLAFAAGQCVGCCIGLSSTLRNGEVRGRIYSLGVVERFRRSGVGSLLLGNVEGRLLRMGARTISLETLDRREGARRFFSRRGYQVTSLLPDYYRPGDALRMAKHFTKLLPT